MKLGDIIIGTEIDVCPHCDGEMITKPLNKIGNEGGPQFSVYCAECPSCKYEGPEYKVHNDYLRKVKEREEKKSEPIDVTPYKWGWLGKELGIFK
jgi:Zn-finger nucleic acid-binding protein